MGLGCRHMLTDKQWSRIEQFFPKPKRRRDGRGRPWASNRGCCEGILWVARNGAPWRELPKPYPSGPTCWRRLRTWEEQGVWRKAWQQLLAELDRRQLLDWNETFLDATFIVAKKGALEWAKPCAGRARSAFWWSMARDFLWEFNSRALNRRSTNSRRVRSPR
jgi:transposase